MKLRAIFAKNLKTMRIQRHLSQEELADLAMLDRAYISKLERAVSSATLDTLEKLSLALDTPPSELVSWGDTQNVAGMQCSHAI